MLKKMQGRSTRSDVPLTCACVKQRGRLVLSPCLGAWKRPGTGHDVTAVGAASRNPTARRSEQNRAAPLANRLASSLHFQWTNHVGLLCTHRTTGADASTDATLLSALSCWTAPGCVQSAGLIGCHFTTAHSAGPPVHQSSPTENGGLQAGYAMLVEAGTKTCRSSRSLARVEEDGHRRGL